MSTLALAAALTLASALPAQERQAQPVEAVPILDSAGGLGFAEGALPSSGPMLDLSEFAIPVFRRIGSPAAQPVMVAHARKPAYAPPAPMAVPASQVGPAHRLMPVANQKASPWQVGDTLKYGERTYTMVRYDGYRNLGSRYHWVSENPDGTREELYCSPLVFDLDGDGVRMSRRTQKFDADGDRRADRVNDISRGDGLLVFDADGDGVAGESALEAFGDSTDLDGDHERDSYADGFEALQALVSKAESSGVLGPQDDARLDAVELKALEKAYGLRIKVGGILAKPVRLSAAGVVSIALSSAESKLVKDFDGQGNRVTRREGARFTRADGSSSSYEDVWFEVIRPSGALVASR